MARYLNIFLSQCRKTCPPWPKLKLNWWYFNFSHHCRIFRRNTEVLLLTPYACISTGPSSRFPRQLSVHADGGHTLAPSLSLSLSILAVATAAPLPPHGRKRLCSCSCEEWRMKDLSSKTSPFPAFVSLSLSTFHFRNEHCYEKRKKYLQVHKNGKLKSTWNF